jgi:hypothetical protein
VTTETRVLAYRCDASVYDTSVYSNFLTNFIIYFL